MQLAGHAQQIADKVEIAGFDPLTILTIISTLLPILMNCFQKANPSASAKDYLTSRYDFETHTFDQNLINQTRPRTRQSAHKNGQRGLSKHDLDKITNQTFQHAINQDDGEYAGAMAEVAAMPSETFDSDL